MSEKKNNLTEATLFTRPECERILANIHDGAHIMWTLRDFLVQPELKTIGYLGQYFQLNLNCVQQKNGDSVEKQEQLFVKALPYANAELCDYILKAGILKKEATLYATLLRELQNFSSDTWCANCFYIRDDLMVMQNLNALGYKPSASDAGHMQTNEFKSLLKGLAAIHSSSIAYETRKQRNIGEVYKEELREITVSAEEPYFATGLRAILAVTKQHPLYQGPEQQAYIDQELEDDLKSVYDMVNPSTRYRNVFCHRDPWGGNIFFKPAETSADIPAAMFVDFQTCRYCPPAIDVVFALHMNLSGNEQKARTAEYLDWYYKCFDEALGRFNISAEEKMTQQQFLDAYQEFRLFGLLYKAIAATILRVPAGYLSNMKLNSPEKYYRYAYVDRIAEVLGLMAESVEFREHMHECVADMMMALRRVA